MPFMLVQQLLIVIGMNYNNCELTSRLFQSMKEHSNIVEIIRQQTKMRKVQGLSLHFFLIHT